MFPDEARLEETFPWQFYPLVVLSSLLLAYLAFLILKKSYSRFGKLQAWLRRLTGQEMAIFVDSLNYYLAITRSTCEVG